MKKNILFIVLILFVFTEISAQNSKSPEMIFVKGGSFKMGSNDGYEDEQPIHNVTLNDFYISKYEITVAQYKKFCKATGRRFPQSPNRSWYTEHSQIREWVWRDNHPIVNVSWNDANAYCQWLSSETGENFSLPTEAQWEYAAKGGAKSNNYEYAGSSNIEKVAWFDETTFERGTKPVGQLSPNELGIYDMSGNVFEWCKDFYGEYSSKNQNNPQGAKSGQYKTIRGGSWYYIDEFCRITQRDSPKATLKKFNYGFRIVKNKK